MLSGTPDTNATRYAATRLRCASCSARGGRLFLSAWKFLLGRMHYIILFHFAFELNILTPEEKSTQCKDTNPNEFCIIHVRYERETLRKSSSKIVKKYRCRSAEFGAVSVLKLHAYGDVFRPHSAMLASRRYTASVASIRSSSCFTASGIGHNPPNFFIIISSILSSASL